MSDDKAAWLVGLSFGVNAFGWFFWVSGMFPIALGFFIAGLALAMSASV